MKPGSHLEWRASVWTSVLIKQQQKGGVGVSVGRGWREAELRSVIGSKQELLLPSLSAHFNDCCGGPSRSSLKLSHSECLKDSQLNHLPSLNSSAATLHSNYKGILVKGHFLKAANSWPFVHQKKKKIHFLKCCSKTSKHQVLDVKKKKLK